MKAVTELRSHIKAWMPQRSKNKRGLIVAELRAYLQKEHPILQIDATYELYDVWLTRQVTNLLAQSASQAGGKGSGPLAKTYSLAHKDAKPLGAMTKPDLERASAYHAQKSALEQLKSLVLARLAPAVGQGQTVDDAVTVEQFTNIVHTVAGRDEDAERLLTGRSQAAQPGAEGAGGPG